MISKFIILLASFEEAESKATKAQVTSELSSNEDHIKATKTVKKTKNNIPTETAVSKYQILHYM